ncbi:hypothetical protein [Gemmatimonas sp.]|jgi:hypothetical protein|uniref:hypothetical protein n=1 Tax=Gemmatimonas sp. TaxID=1962908 RepID=UPI0031C2D521|nr:hypothetical protein [Gemmatimonas sp.]
MRGAMKRGAVMAVVLAGACGGFSEREAKVKPTPDVVNISANCTAPNQIDVKSDNWEAEVKKQLDVTFNVVSTSTPAAIVEIDKTTLDKWAFDQLPPFTFGPANGGTTKKGKAKNVKGDFRYVIRVTCGTQTVVIDPDIFVD